MTPKEFAERADWQIAFANNPKGFIPQATEGYEGSLEPFALTDVVEVLEHYGDDEDLEFSDEPRLFVAFRLRDGRFLCSVATRCYTGWECSSTVRTVVAATWEELERWGIEQADRECLREIKARRANPSEPSHEARG